ncbi:AAA family ATPase [Evansella sp. AB-rgal1]|uniref:AAA family ATPase n=1 Tax=Evansella sp. AB-rgal1 TaxID=3242696 RepID=UPI00359D8B59
MSKAFREYITFLKESEEEFSDIEKKLANIVLQNTVSIEETSNALGKRGKLIASLIEEFGDSVESTFSLDEDREVVSENNIKFLSELSVKNFRGFSDEIKFELNKPYIFVYGPNGTGKTSFCEALEYSLLGTIHEADAKRINLDTYVKNVYTGNANKPVLKGVNSEGVPFQIQPIPQVNEFCFIERNRIEGFARVSANTPQAQQQRLASLFGLDDFNRFVNNFNERMDNYLECTGKLSEELSGKEKQIEIHKNNLEMLPHQREEILKQTEQLLNQYKDVNSLDELKIKLNGTDEKKGLIQINNARIAQLENLKQKNDPGVDEVIECIKQLSLLTQERNEAISLVKEYKNEINLKDLYTAILSIEEKFQDVCPACESQLYVNGDLVVPLNPYSNATDKIQDFDKAIKLENRFDELNEIIPNKLQLIENKFIQMVAISETIEFPEAATIEALFKLLEDKEYEHIQNDIIATLLYQIDTLSAFKDYLAEFNRKITGDQIEIEMLRRENQQLNCKLEEISTLNVQIKVLNKSESDANIAIEQFSNENEELIEKVSKEKEIVTLNCQFRDAYGSFRNRLVDYNRQLPALLATNLNTKTLEFYNSINKYDHPSDLIEEIFLPDGSGKKIEIRFTDGEKVDALHVLSEGHIRCLGLAILLAKNTQDELPLVIFDDVVNAIDHEHRRGIIETILSREFNDSKQLIITTHGEEFLKQLENSIVKKEYPKLVTRIDFLKTEESKKINVRLNVPRNYLVLAEQRYQEGQIRESLAIGRRAFEHLVRTIWKRLSKKYNIRINVSMSGPDRPPELMATTLGLVNYIKKNKIENHEELVSLLESLLEKEQIHPVIWNYLNKGTHDEEREEEFDRSVVKDVIELLEQIDEVVMNK